ncbi:MAG: DUF2797 domain-containing protein [Bacteroidales bacterium]
MKLTGNLSKMKSALHETGGGSYAKYKLDIAGHLVDMNELAGREISIRYTGEINCIHCGRKTSKSFAQGYCYPCFISLPQTDSCILRPELCRAHEGISRDMEWSGKNCLTEHIVYLALTPGLKVGVTRSGQVPVRWIDQGAWEAIPIASAPNRYTAGLIEVFLKAHFADKTNWREMLTGVKPVVEDIISEKIRAAGYLDQGFSEFIIKENRQVSINYPVISYPGKVKPVNMEAVPVVQGLLSGIRGQYLIFENGSVLNIRKYGGYLVDIEY